MEDAFKQFIISLGGSAEPILTELELGYACSVFQAMLEAGAVEENSAVDTLSEVVLTIAKAKYGISRNLSYIKQTWGKTP